MPTRKATLKDFCARERASLLHKISVEVARVPLNTPFVDMPDPTALREARRSVVSHGFVHSLITAGHANA